MPMYTVTNPTRASHVVYDVRGRTAAVRAGTTRAHVEMSERDVKRMTGSGLVFVEEKLGQIGDVGGADWSRPTPEPEQAPAPAPERVQGRNERAQVLLSRYRGKEIEFHALVAGAKEIVGTDGWPGGTPRKSIVLSLLENVEDDK